MCPSLEAEKLGEGPMCVGQAKDSVWERETRKNHAGLSVKKAACGQRAGFHFRADGPPQPEFRHAL